MKDLNQFIDHTLLKPTASSKDISTLCKEAKDHEFKAVCVPPYYLEQAKKELKNSDVLLCTVIGFPFGYAHIGTKVDEITRAIDAGADELDIVVNIAAVKNGDWETVERELDSLNTAAKLKKNKIIKLIFETSYLTNEEIKLLCNLCVKYKIDYAKTSTGYAPEGASIEHVELMAECLKDKVGIKASGGIKTKAFAKKIIAAGATRIGTSAGVQLIK